MLFWALNEYDKVPAVMEKLLEWGRQEMHGTCTMRQVVLTLGGANKGVRRDGQGNLCGRNYI